MVKINRLVLRCKYLLSQLWGKYNQFRSVDKLSENNNEPVFVYQMGKVASSSIYNSLKSQGFCTYHAHVLNFPRGKKIPEGFEQIIKYGRKLRKQLFGRGKPLKIITLTRDPIARNISAYFQNLDSIHKKHVAHEDVPISTLISKFIECYDHTIPLNWFDRELSEVTGINAYDYEFPKDKGFMIVQKNEIHILIMHAELANATKSKIIGEFVGLPDFKLDNHNISSQKNYSKQYTDFLDLISLPHSYVDDLLNSKYSKNFYSNQDLAGFREKWLKETR